MMAQAEQGASEVEARDVILLVEDAQGFARIVERVLRRTGYAVELVATGREALDWLDTQTPLLLLLDFNLPDMTGREVVAHLRAAERRIPFIIITGNGDERIAVDMMKLGALDYLVKDERFLALLPAVVAQACDRVETQRRLVAAEKKLDENEEYLRKLSRAIEQSPSVLVITDAEGCIEYVNPAFTQVTGYAPEEVLGKSPALLSSNSQQEGFYRELWETIRGGQEWRGEFFNCRKSGESYWERATISPVKDAQGRVTHFLKVAEDVTARKSADEKIHSLTYYDSLTGLPNQILFRDRLDQALARAQRGDEKLAVVVVDLDQFQRINNAFAHGFGDKVLKETARRLSCAMRAEDSVARFWGDSFLLALPQLQGEQDAARVALKILESLTPAFRIDQREIYLTASLGLAMFPHDGTTVEMLLKNAETALARTKEIGPNSFQLYNPSMNRRATENLMLQGDLRRALERNEFLLYYQPQFDTATRRLVGAEALVRWQHPVLGLLAPDRFIGLAEESNLISPLGAWVIREGCRQLRSWLDSGVEDFNLSINLSPRQFHGSDCLAAIDAGAESHGISPAHLTFEITETLIMKNTGEAARILMRMKERGYQLALDDFGTGYSSLSYLQKFPFDLIKIDKSFVMDSDKNPQNAAICRTIIAMAHSLNLKVLAEGVEKEEHDLFLRNNSCDQMQGYLFSPPLTVSAFESQWLGASRLV
ncbi:response regulator receiver modulated diguanylate cyclase/phosphodiesterase with PAS/PAC sensor(s) [Geoalkalibacter ferrihydriticus]|uniref:Response regulator receiver modulated diguanylate cyclase/phosphodiesterase with PAS/PAC sensor(S) n=1 Tax=Geoalkalibacter ferrihydriticus TaxID=392333 RepID=A0A1G9VHR2_9BACT|nr:EAL domain-containing protein [Geoalkalibacter ferrihydriticus]SDM71355.1 response regulator receiver modulated diguanylate cyclase/phosphodiesterase with PAS/PAC sensor(s) [Geoalkalibacter ferrihydriticus]